MGKGDNVALCGANSAGWILSFWATLSLGAVAVAMNGWWTETEMGHALELTEPKVLLADARRAERLPAGLTAPLVDLDADLATMLAHAPDAALPDTPIAEDDPAMLIFTSGTTGRAKAAVLDAPVDRRLHRCCRTSSAPAAWCSPAGARPAVRRRCAWPCSRSSTSRASAPPSTASTTGSTTVWPLGRFDAGTVIDLTVRYGINVWGGTGTHVLRLRRARRHRPHRPGAAGVGRHGRLRHHARHHPPGRDQAFPHLDGTMSTGYGSTETGALVSFAPNWMLVASPDCIGPPLPTVDVRITGPMGEVLPEGEEGDICVRSPLLMKGYYRNDAANAEAFDDGRWFNTGDFGRLEGGVLHIASRKRDLIIRGGENVYPFEVENRLDEHDEIVEAAVIGVDHPDLGQEVKAIVVVTADSTLTEDDVRAHCAETLASFKVPSQVELRAEPLPRNPSGKVLKNVLAGDAQTNFVEE